MDRQVVIDSDNHELGAVVDERDGCVIVESGHLRKTRHAIPETFLHREGDEIRATVTREVVNASPKIDLDRWDPETVRLSYGLSTPLEVDPESVDEVESLGRGVEPAPAQRARLMRDETGEPDVDRPAVHERQANAADPVGMTANLTDRKPEEPER
jgi:hypothetical protein